MTAATIAVANRTAQDTHTGDTNWTNVGTPSDNVDQVPLEDLEASTQYLVIAIASVAGNTSGANYGVRLVEQDGTPTVIATHTFYTNDSSTLEQNGHTFQFAGLYTTPGTPVDVGWQIQTANSGNTASIRAAVIRMYKLSELTQNNDEDTSGPTAHTTSFATRASVTFTPATASNDWWIIAAGRYSIDNNSVDLEQRIDRDSAEQVQTISFTGLDASEDYWIMNEWVFNLTAASHTISLESRDNASDAAQNDYEDSFIIAIDLDDTFNDHAFAVGTTGDTISSTFTWEDVLDAQVTFTPPATDDYEVAGALAADDASATTTQNMIRFEDDGTEFGGSQAHRTHSTDDVGVILVNHATRNLDNTEHIVNMRMWCSLTSLFDNQCLVLHSHELAAAAASNTAPMRRRYEGY